MSLLLSVLVGAGIAGLVVGYIKPLAARREESARLDAMAADVAELTGFDRAAQQPAGVRRLVGARGEFSVVVRLVAHEGTLAAYIEVTGAKLLPVGTSVRTVRGRHAVTPAEEALPPGWAELLTRWAPRDFHLTIEPDCFTARTEVRDAREVADLIVDASQQLAALSLKGAYR